MAYEAIVTKLKNVRPHSNGERVKLADVLGLQIVIGLDNYEGELGIFFSDDGCLSSDMAKNNNLYCQKELNINTTKSGYFGKNARVRAQSFRGEKSYGFWIELKSVEWTGVNLDELKEGFTFTHLNGKEVCKKYLNPATLKHIQSTQNRKKINLNNAIRQRFAQLKPHFDTKQLRYNIHNIPVGSILYITSKLHGTSGRTGNIYAKVPLKRGKSLWNKYFRWPRFSRKMEYQVVSGTRRVVLDPNRAVDNGYYSGKTFRIDIHNELKTLGLGNSITLYYEIVGFDETGKQIMPSQSVNKIKDKKLQKLIKRKYGDTMTFSYGCQFDHPLPHLRYNFFVYRATTTSLDNVVYELPWSQVKDLCNTLAIRYVPELRGPIIYKGDMVKNGLSEDFEYYGTESQEELLLKVVESYLDQPEEIDPRHIREGVCIRVETPDGRTYILKDKGFVFRVIEGIIKQDDSVIDTEETESLTTDGETE